MTQPHTAPMTPKELVEQANIPGPSPDEAKGGWHISFAYLEKFRDESDERTGYQTTLESAEDIILATLRSAALLPARESEMTAAEMREACAKVCDDQSATFLSPEYAAGQPLSSFSERFACGRIAERIRSLPTTALASNLCGPGSSETAEVMK